MGGAVTTTADIFAGSDQARAERIARAHQVHEQSFGSHRAARSEPYRDGCLAALLTAADGETRDCPFRAGSTHSDAWLAGYAEGHMRSRRQL
jgi:hypothetical protein